ncbi:integrase [Dyella sp.]|uniref:integrase n=1 Tax=Dyella sp. TaxID=1869338 RepID=UPI002FDA8E22
MSRGRPRKFDPTVPKHIDQQKLPKGAFWDARDQVWYTLVRKGAKQQRRLLARNTATLADLHRLVQELKDGDQPGSIRWLQEEFEKSDQWKELVPATQRDYQNCLARLAKLKTRMGTADLLLVNKLRKSDVQLIVDEIGKKTPAMANHIKRWLGRLFVWGMQRGRMADRENPAHGLDAAKEKSSAKVPTPQVMERVMAFARERGALKPHTRGSCPAYIWPAMVLTYRCRQRGIEALLLRDADKHKDGIYTSRRKGSDDNITKWSPELEEAWAVAIDYRRQVWARLKKAEPIRPEDRPLLVNQGGETLARLNEKGEIETRSAFDTAWQRFIRMAMRDGVITPEQRFTMHGLKHRGITDTEGGKEAKRLGAGHRTTQMTDRYDHEVPIVEPAGKHSK